MNNEEKKAIDKLKRSANYFVMPMHETTIVLNPIEKQQKNYQSCMDYADSLNKDIGELLLNLEQKDKIINEMAKYIDDTQMECNVYYKDKNEVIEDFKKKVGE